ncbi:molybdenum cofactor biosynthesis protein [Terrilactibacillus sp. BCM23-1]|uniref:Molybdenum cofactor biosynthesis protein B n=1 Tax=Terrilactibacillus tamarindi TaxID=2599694 RepID=A0A6N8CRZ0_9BACI|nr:MogA/MoaB family molybdenum cofactor biosynthesis protein [Terrilactibacillus tamarindi]MTT31833.1 molybdenum cofactor biosynthesis protein [Terrilactibacillus tamarindi]
MSVQEHKRQADQRIRCQVITISDTRTTETDKSGALIIDLIEKQGFSVSAYHIVKDEKEMIQQAIRWGCRDEQTQAILMNGGTGITKRDVTIEAVKAMIDKEIVGFGELFRMLSYTEDIGSAALMSRALAGTVQNKVIFAMPGSSGAVRLAMNKLILPELAHVIWELNRH